MLEERSLGPRTLRSLAARAPSDRNALDKNGQHELSHSHEAAAERVCRDLQYTLTTI